MNERILQYVWKHRLYNEFELHTTDGLAVTVIDPGLLNTDAGPDFFNAKVRIENTIWAGDVEIHCKSSDWIRHKHDKDPAYDSVILHIVGECDMPVYRGNGEPILQVILHIPEKVQRSIDWLLSREQTVPCATHLREISLTFLSDWLSALLSERLERKTEDILRRLQQTQNDWNEVFYITLTRNFGFGTNSDAFEWLAGSLPFKYIRKQSNNSLQIEALLFGQAGLLGGNKEDVYYQTLQREYVFLQKKYGLKPVSGFLFKKLRTRPINFPHLRLAQLAAIWTRNDTLFSEIIEGASTEKLKSRFNVPLSEYWNTHYHFDNPSPARKKSIGLNATHIILINTVVPILFAYGKQKKQYEYCERALCLLENIPAERNSIIKTFTDAGLSAGNASDSQALIQLRREYCDKKKCLYCRIGFRLIKNGLL